jgi:hypothetical protein
LTIEEVPGPRIRLPLIEVEEDPGPQTSGLQLTIIIIIIIIKAFIHLSILVTNTKFLQKIIFEMNGG